MRKESRTEEKREAKVGRDRKEIAGDREEVENRGYVDEEGVWHGLDQDEKLFR
jgi:hypothetical protein